MSDAVKAEEEVCEPEGVSGWGVGGRCDQEGALLVHRLRVEPSELAQLVKVDFSPFVFVTVPHGSH